MKELKARVMMMIAVFHVMLCFAKGMIKGQSCDKGSDVVENKVSRGSPTTGEPCEVPVLLIKLCSFLALLFYIAIMHFSSKLSLLTATKTIPSPQRSFRFPFVFLFSFSLSGLLY